MADENRSRLGRGLAALMGEMGDEGAIVDRARGGARKVPLAFLKPSPGNPRQVWNDADLDELAQSIREKGIIQPILVRAIPTDRDRYEIVAGERRWRAAQRAGLHDAPIVVVEASDKDVLELALIENVQRVDLDPLDEAAGYQRLIAEFGYTQEDLSRVVGKSRSHVANTMRMLGMSEKLRGLVRRGDLSAGHARAIMTAANADELADRIVSDGLTVRQAEALTQEQRATPPATRARGGKGPKDADTRALEKALSDSLGLAVSITHKGQGGRVMIDYRDLEQLDDLCRRLQGR
jgi:ParB family chromosome partitioning protein